VVDVPWPSTGYTRVQTSTFSGGDVTVFRITVPASAAISNSYGRLSGIYTSNAEQPKREAALSTQPCDLSSSLAVGAYTTSSNTVYMPFRVGSGDGYYPGLKAGSTYYLTVKNLTCSGGGNCNMIMDLYKPN
jgi:hypothetical protein